MRMFRVCDVVTQWLLRSYLGLAFIKDIYSICSHSPRGIWLFIYLTKP